MGLAYRFDSEGRWLSTILRRISETQREDRSRRTHVPRIDNFPGLIGEAEIFPTLNCVAEYWQVPVAPEDRDKTTFTSYVGAFGYKWRPIGLLNAPATFQHARDIIVGGYRWQSCPIYLDDVIVFSRNNQKG